MTPAMRTTSGLVLPDAWLAPLRFRGGELGGGGNDRLPECALDGYGEIIMRPRKWRRAKRLVAAPANENCPYRRFVQSHDKRAAGGSVPGIAVERKFPCSFVP